MTTNSIMTDVITDEDLYRLFKPDGTSGGTEVALVGEDPGTNSSYGFAAVATGIAERRQGSGVGGTAADWPQVVGADRTSYAVADDERLAVLEYLAASQQAEEFARNVRAMDWSLASPQDFATVIRLAILANAPLLARRLASEGAQLHPQSRELAIAARVLAPPRVRVVHGARPRQDLRANHDWLSRNRESYRGYWVALKDGTLLAQAESAEALFQQIGDVRHKRILVTRIG